MATKEQQIVQDIKTLMEGWNKIEAKAKQEFPFATSEELYHITKGAMDYSLGLDKK